MIKTNSRGQSMFEVIIALAISALIIIALVSLVTNSVRNATFSRNQTIASNYSQEAVEWLRGQRDSDVTTFMTNVQTPTYCLLDLSWNHPGKCGTSNPITGTVFTRQVDFTVTTVSGKTLVSASVHVYWGDSLGLHEVNNATSYTDWRQR